MRRERQICHPRRNAPSGKEDLTAVNCQKHMRKAFLVSFSSLLRLGMQSNVKGLTPALFFPRLGSYSREVLGQFTLFPSMQNILTLAFSPQCVKC